MSHRKDVVPFLKAQDENENFNMIFTTRILRWSRWMIPKTIPTLLVYIKLASKLIKQRLLWSIFWLAFFCAQYVKPQFYFDSKNTKAASRLSREKMRKNLAVVFKFHSRTPTTLCLHYIRENNKLTTEKDAHTQSLTHSRTHS